MTKEELKNGKYLESLIDLIAKEIHSWVGATSFDEKEIKVNTGKWIATKNINFEVIKSMAITALQKELKELEDKFFQL